MNRNVLSSHTATPWSLVVLDGMGPGYGHPTADGEEAREWAREAGIAVDSTYGGKALAGLPRVVRAGSKRVVFWHTYAAPDARAGGV